MPHYASRNPVLTFKSIPCYKLSIAQQEITGTLGAIKFQSVQGNYEE